MSEASASVAGVRAGQNRGYVLALLTLVYAFNFVDRQILGILAPSIAAELGFADTEIGLLTGFVFAMFYTVLGVPIALLADRTSRVRIVAAALAIWSGFTFLSGFVTSFAWLALARVGVAIGEAGGSPPSHALLSDLYGRTERGRALAVYSLGIPFGIMVAFFTAAALSTAEATNWRLVFFVLGAPGVALAVLITLTVREPERGRLDAPAPRASLGEALRKLLAFPSYWYMCLGISFASFSGYATSAFIVTYITRAFPGVGLPTVLVWLGVVNGTMYAAGTYAGGALADRYAKRSVASYGLVSGLSLLVTVPGLILSLLTDSFGVFLALISVNVFFGGFYLGPSFSVAQNLAPPAVRATSTAIFFFVLNLIALGGGPTVTGYLSDAFATGAIGPGVGEEAGLRYALFALMVPYFVAIVFYLLAARALPRDWARANDDLA